MSSNTWINPTDGSFYYGDKIPFSDHIPAVAPAPGVTHAVLDENGAFEAWADPPAPAPDYPAFRNAIAGLSGWRSLIAADGRAVELSRCLGAEDLTTALVWWTDLVADDKVSATLRAEIVPLAVMTNMPQALVAALDV